MWIIFLNNVNEEKKKNHDINVFYIVYLFILNYDNHAYSITKKRFKVTLQ